MFRAFIFNEQMWGIGRSGAGIWVTSIDRKLAVNISTKKTEGDNCQMEETNDVKKKKKNLREKKVFFFGELRNWQYLHVVAQMVKNLPAMQDTWVWSLGWKDPLEKGMATHSSILAWKIPWTEGPGRLQSMGLLRVGRTKRLLLHFTIEGVFENYLKKPKELRMWR